MRRLFGGDPPFNIDGLRSRCMQRLPRSLMDFYEGGAEDEQTLRENIDAYARQPLWPHVFQGFQSPDFGTEVFGRKVRVPFGVAPMGALGFGWPNADLALSRAAARTGTIYTLSTMACATPEAMAVGDGRRWFQAHLFTPRSRTLDLISRARDCGYEALVITADLPVGGKRERDLCHQFRLPFKVRPQHAFDFAAHPRWLADLLRHGVPELPNLQADPVRSSHSTIGHGFDAGFDWAALGELRAAWTGPLVIKGVIRPADAVRAADAGADAVWVSNHGGRQMDGCVASLVALRAVKEALGGRVPVFFDGGVRRGRHVLQALATGADFVFLGRAALYGVCAAGFDGALAAFDLLEDELARSMRLCGVASLREAHSLLTADDLPALNRRAAPEGIQR